MNRKTDTEAPRRGDVLRAERLRQLTPDKKQDLVRALKQRIRGLLISTMQAGSQYYTPVEMIEFIEEEASDLRATAEGKEHRALRKQRLREIHIVIEDPPGPASSFVEVEDKNGKSIKVGEWIERADGLWALVIKGHGLE